MLKRTFVLASPVIALAVLGVLLLGPSHLLNLVITQRDRLKEETSQLVDPAVELESAVREADRELPKQVASLALAIEDTDNELATQVHALKELEQALVLIEGDLMVLAPVVLEEKAGACELHGRKYTSHEAKRMAQRLIDKKRQYTDLVDARRKTIEKLREQRRELEEHLATAHDALAEVTTNAKHLESKIALVKANEKIEALQGLLQNGRVSTNTASALQQLERRLDAQLQEGEARAQFREGLAATDPYVTEVREEQMYRELRPYSAEQTGSQETGQ